MKKENIKATEISDRLEVGTVVRAMPSWYEIDSEQIMELDGRKIAYTVGRAIVDNSCCGRYGCRFAAVRGFLNENPSHIKSTSMDIKQEYQPIIDGLWQNRVSEAIYKEETVDQIQFL